MMSVSIFEFACLTSIARLRLSCRKCGKAFTWRKEPIESLKRSFVIQFEPVPRQISDRDHHEVVPLAEPDEIRHARHGAIVVDNLADHAGGVEAGEMGQVDRRLRLPPALQDAARASPKRENMA